MINIHAGAGLPDYGELEIARAIMLVELPWFCHRPLWHLIFGGVFERFPDLQGGPHRAGRGLAPARARDPRLVLRPHDPRRRGRGPLLRRRGRGHVDEAVGVLRPQRLGRRVASSGRRSRRCATSSASTGSCGATTTPTPRAPGPSAARRCGWPSPARTPTSCSAASGTNAAAALRLRPRGPAHRWRHGSGPTVAEVAAPLAVERLPDRVDLATPSTPPGAAVLVAARSARAALVSGWLDAVLGHPPLGRRPVRRGRPAGAGPGPRSCGVGPIRSAIGCERVEVEAVDPGRGHAEQLGGLVHRHVGEVGLQLGRGVRPRCPRGAGSRCPTSPRRVPMTCRRRISSFDMVEAPMKRLVPK